MIFLVTSQSLKFSSRTPMREHRVSSNTIFVLQKIRFEKRNFAYVRGNYTNTVASFTASCLQFNIQNAVGLKILALSRGNFL